MQTFLPDSDFKLSAKVLDYRRLGKQRVEAWQILNTLLGKSSGWKNHPAVKQWKEYEYHLAEYGYEICAEWRHRGYNDTLLPKFLAVRKKLPKTELPWWIGCLEYHASHRSNLLRKNKKYYSQFNWQESDNLPYIWPSNMEVEKCV